MKLETTTYIGGLSLQSLGGLGVDFVGGLGVVLGWVGLLLIGSLLLFTWQRDAPQGLCVPSK